MASEWKPVRDTLRSSAILIIPRMFFRGVLLYFSWLWFAVPYGLPELDYWTATVLGGVISMLTFEHIGEGKETGIAFKRMIEWIIGISAFFAMVVLIHLGMVYG